MWKSAGRAPDLQVLPWHLPYNATDATLSILISLPGSLNEMQIGLL
jgi:hypothetical protein